MAWPDDITVSGVTYTKNPDGGYGAPGKPGVTAQQAEAYHARTAPDKLTFDERTYTRQNDGSYKSSGPLGFNEKNLSGSDAARAINNGSAKSVGGEPTAQDDQLATDFFYNLQKTGDLSPTVMIKPGDENKDNPQFVWASSDRITGKITPSKDAAGNYAYAPAPSQYIRQAASPGPNPTNGTTHVTQDGSVYYFPPYGGQAQKIGNMPADLPNLTFQTEASGDLVGLDPRTGKVATRIVGFAYRQYSPEDVRAQVVSDLANSQAFTASENAQTRSATSAENAANRAFQGNESATGRSFTAAQDVLKAANDADAAAIARAYQTYSTQGAQKFTAGENAINRALTSGQFAATNALDLADRAAAAKRDDLARNLAYVEMTKSPDLTGFQRLMQANGNNIGNALLGRGDSLTEQGQLGAARTLRDIRTPYVPPAGYKDPNANFNFQDTAYMTQNDFVAPVFPTRASTFVEPERTYSPMYNAPTVPIKTVTPVAAPKAQLTAQQDLAAHIVPTAANSSNFENRPTNAAEISAWQASIPGAPYFVTGNPASPGGPNYVPSGTTGLAYGTGPGAMPIYRSAVATPPMGGGMDTVTGRYAYGLLGMMGAPRYALGNPMMMGQPAPPMPAMDGGMSPFGDMGQPATGTFITGDSTDPMDPAAGGAQPEMVTLNDPEGNATADVVPMTQPGVGPDEGEGEASVGALLMAISKFLLAEEAKSAVAMPPPPMMGPELGMMGAPRQAYGALGMPRYNMGAFGRYNMGMPRYAAGTMPGFEISAEDQPYVNEVLATRRATPYDVNPFAANYQMQSPTARAIGESAFQTATGVPGTELDYISKMYEPQGLARQSTYNQELQLGI